MTRRTRQHLSISATPILFAVALTGCHHSDTNREQIFAPASQPAAERALDDELKELAPMHMTVAARVEHFARQSLGQPYKLGLLGEFPVELYDADPLYDLAESDCVTFVEQTYAKALARDWPTFFRNLIHLRYKEGRIGLLTRNHFTESDWNTNNAWAFEDVTNEAADGATRPMRVVIDRATFFKPFNLGQDLPIETINTTYISRDLLKSIDHNLKTGDIIEFVRGKPEAPYVGHLGLIVGRSNDRANLIHSAEPCVREEPLIDYVNRLQNIIGIKVLRCRFDLPPES